MGLFDHEDYYVSDFPHAGGKPSGERVTKLCNTACTGCPKAQTEGHESYSYAWLTEPAADNERWSLRILRALRGTVQRTRHLTRGLVGWSKGFPYNATASNNFADFQVWFVVAVDNGGYDLTLFCPGENPADRAIASALVTAPEVGLSRFPRQFRGMIDVGDYLQFDEPSVLAMKVLPRVVQIVGGNIASNAVVVRVNINCTNVFFSTDRNTATEELPYIGCKSWREAGDPERWQRINAHSYLQGAQRLSRVRSRDLPAHGRYELTKSNGTATCIAAPRNEPQRNFYCLAIDADGVTTDITERLKSDGRIKCQTTRFGQYKTEICFGTTDHEGNAEAFSADLREEYSAGFAIAYVAQAVEGDRMEIWGHQRCKFSVRDWSNSVGNRGLSRGVAIDGNGNHWYCAKAAIETRTPVYGTVTGANGAQWFDQIGETLTYEAVAGLDNYPEGSGLCMQYGVCPGFEPLEHDTSEFAAFSISRHLARWFREIWFGLSVGLQQGLPGNSSIRNWKLYRPQSGTSSLSELAGYNEYELTSPRGVHPTTVFPNNSTVESASIGDYEIKTLESGEQRLIPKVGSWWRQPENFDGFDWVEGSLDAGVFNRLVPGWAGFRTDPLLGYLNGTKDPRLDFETVPPLLDYQLTRDTGEWSGGGLTRWGYALKDTESILVPDVPARIGTYDRGDVIAQVVANVEGPTVTGLGLRQLGDGAIRVQGNGRLDAGVYRIKIKVVGTEEHKQLRITATEELPRNVSPVAGESVSLPCNLYFVAVDDTQTMTLGAEANITVDANNRGADVPGFPDDFKAGIVFAIKKTIPDGKLDEITVSGTVHSCRKLDNGLFEIEIATADDQWDVVFAPPGEKPYDKITVVKVGGNFCDPKFARNNISFYANHKGVGAAQRCRRGMSVSFSSDVEHNGLNGNQCRFPVVVAEAHGGGADDWGTQTVVVNYELPGAFYFNRANLRLFQNDLLGDPDDSNWVHGPPVAQPVFRTTEVFSAVATTIRVAAQGPALGYPVSTGARVRVITTNEIMVVESFSSIEGSNEAIWTVTRGAGAGTLDPSVNLIWEMVTDGTEVPLVQRREVARPRSLANREYWVDAENLAVYFGAPRSLTARYCVLDKPEEAYTEAITLPATITIDTLFDITKPVEVSYTGQDVLLSQTTEAPGLNQYRLINASGVARLEFNYADAGRQVTISQVTGTPGAPPGRWSLAPNAEANRRDKIIIRDNNIGWLDATHESLAGKTISARVNAGVFLDEAEPKVFASDYQGDFSLEFSARTDGGRGIYALAYTDYKTAVDTFGRRICWRLE